ncbi:putative Peptidase M48, Ste24p [Candidatus Nitrospira inopinata]|uniref:Putative Peptidase M48, Ste24p n=2 Tax=Candidatus Nitrospira inopinata TaxID=1715989 RepID=A0A0S4KS00_9BACT|nr:putative Peptidase M48, Ste24p [Candidatus Nitrospira inopinata]
MTVKSRKSPAVTSERRVGGGRDAMQGCRDVMRFVGTAVLLLMGGMTVAGCETNPYTGRSQLLMTSISQEMQLGEQAYAQVKSDPNIRLARDPREVEPVKRVAARIIEAAKRSKYAEMAKQFEWEVTVIKDDRTANAFALPGGKIAVYTGIFPVARTEAGLAAVMGHEVIHALARHGAERMSQGQLTNAALQVAGAAIGASGGNPLLGQATMAALGLGAQVGVLLPFSRKHESEADYVGILLAADAGYDPRESVGLWERMAELSSGGGPAEFLSTHPSHGTRIEQLKAWMPEAMAIYQKRTPAPNGLLPPVGNQ